MKNIFFNSEDHTYRNAEGEMYESISRVFKPYAEQFNKEFNSSRSAIKELHFDDYKAVSRKYGFDHPKLIEYLMPFVTDMDKFKKVKQEFLDKWEKKGKERRDIGSFVHDKEEHREISEGFGYNPFRDKYFKTFTQRDDVKGYDNKSAFIDNPYKDLEDGYYPEFLLSSDKHKIAGQEDRFFIESIGPYRFIDIDDLKTDEVIYKTPSFFHPTKGYKTLRDPIGHLLDTNLNAYSIKNSFYAYMAKMWGFIPRNIAITNLNIDYETGEIFSKDIYHLPYREKEVKMILKRRKLLKNS